MPERLVGSSPELERVREKIRTAARFDEPVLILGESGVGKELVAGAIHDASSRAANALHVVNCAGVDPMVLTSELFGHRRGAFTDARDDRRGRILAANGSSLVLDEISETQPAFQAALLRAIEQGEVQPVGADTVVEADVRYLATSNQPAACLFSGEALRFDLVHRLAVFVIEVPSLRARPKDIDDLADHFLRAYSDKYGETRALSPGARALIHNHAFPGNVRELRQVLVRAYASTPGSTIAPDTVEECILSPVSRIGGASHSAAASAAPRALEDIIRSHIQRVLALSDGNLSQSARTLDIPRSTLQHYLSKYELESAARLARGRRAAS